MTRTTRTANIVFRAAGVGLLSIAIGCGGKGPSAPTAPSVPTPAPVPSAPAPAVTSVSPTSGSTAGGTTVTVTGSGFVSGAAVTIGGSAATSVSVASSTSLTAVTAPHAAGATDVVVRNPDGQSGQRTAAFTYVVPPSTINGDWSGVSSGGDAVLFTVQANGMASFSFFPNAASPCPLNFTFTFSPPLVITNNEFSRPPISGRFSSTTEASGSFILSGTSTCTFNATWTATRR